MSKEQFHNDAGWIKNPDTAHDVAKIEDEDNLPLPRTKMEEFLRHMPWNKSKEKANIEEAQKEADEYEKMRLEQFEIGEEIFSEIEKAATENQNFNVLDGKPVEGVGPMRVWKIENNGTKYSVVVQIDSKEAMQGNYPLYQIDINLASSGKEIHVFTAPYGPDNSYAIQSKDLIVEKLAKQVSEFRLYKE
jgi:hypothetical protein